jgi:hypothetical protein
MSYNYKVIECKTKNSGLVDLKKVNPQRSKYVDWDTFNRTIGELKDSITEQSKLLQKIANKVGI